MDPKRVFSTQHWLHTCRLPKVKFFIKRAIGVIPNRYVGISFVHIWFLFAHRIVFNSRNIQTTGPIVPKKSAWSHWKKCICLFFRDITNDSFHQKVSNLLKVHFFTKQFKPQSTLSIYQEFLWLDNFTEFPFHGFKPHFPFDMISSKHKKVVLVTLTIWWLELFSKEMDGPLVTMTCILYLFGNLE